MLTYLMFPRRFNVKFNDDNDNSPTALKRDGDSTQFTYMTRENKSVYW